MAVPQDTTKLFQLPTYEYVGSPARTLATAEPSMPLPAKATLPKPGPKLLDLLGKLSCSPARDAAPAIARMKSSEPDIFQNVGLYMHALVLLENYR